ncbi:MAG: flavoprotein [Bacilli bacterium]
MLKHMQNAVILKKKRAVVAITGASGIICALRLLKILMDNKAEIFCIATNSAKEILHHETGGEKCVFDALLKTCPKEYVEKSKNKFSTNRFSAPLPAARSFSTQWR